MPRRRQGSVPSLQLHKASGRARVWIKGRDYWLGKWGGEVKDYLAIHEWFDGSKAHLADFRHRALRHHSEGIFMAEAIFGRSITTSTGREVPTRFVGEQHVMEDLGRIPTVADWLGNIKPETWMVGVHR